MPESMHIHIWAEFYIPFGRYDYNMVLVRHLRHPLHQTASGHRRGMSGEIQRKSTWNVKNTKNKRWPHVNTRVITAKFPPRNVVRWTSCWSSWSRRCHHLSLQLFHRPNRPSRGETRHEIRLQQVQRQPPPPASGAWWCGDTEYRIVCFSNSVLFW